MASEGLSWRPESGARGLETLWDAWERLAEGAVAPTADPVWTRCLWNAIGGDDGDLALHALYAGERLVAVLPLRRRGSVARVWSSLTDVRFSHYTTFAAEEGLDLGAAVLSHLFESADVVHFERLHQEGALCVSLCAAAREGGLRVVARPQGGDTRTELQTDWETFRKDLSTKLRKNTERAIRQLEGLGRLEFEVVHDHETLADLVYECFALERLGWKGERGWTVVDTPEALGFYKELAQALAPRGRLALYLLRLDGRLVSFDYCTRVGSRINLLKTTYDPEFHRYSPSNVLRYRMFEHELGLQQMRSYHYGDPSDWKLRWTDQVEPLVSLQIFGPGVRARVASAGLSARRAIGRARRAIGSR